MRIEHSTKVSGLLFDYERHAVLDTDKALGLLGRVNPLSRLAQADREEIAQGKRWDYVGRKGR